MGPPRAGPDVPSDAQILVVEEDDALAQRYVRWLADRWTVETVRGGSRAIAALESEPDVVVLRRQLSAIHGDRLLGMTRERDIGSRVAMITSVDPGPAAVRLGFDDHLVDPVTEDELVSTVEELLLRGVYERRVREFYALARRKAEYESTRTPEELEENEAYQAVRVDVLDARERVDDVLSAFREHDAYSRLCDELTRRPRRTDVDGSVPEP